MQAAPRSGLARAGEVLLLVGAIVRTAAAVILALAAVGFLVWATVLGEGEMHGLGLVSFVYLGLAVLLGVGAGLAWVAWRRAKRGQYRSPAILAIVASFLPPLDLVLLLGGIFLMVCDEARHEPRAPA